MAAGTAPTTNGADSSAGSVASHCTTGVQVVIHQTMIVLKVAAIAPAAVARRQKMPIQKATAMMALAFQRISSPCTTPSKEKAKASPSATTPNAETRAARR